MTSTHAYAQSVSKYNKAAAALQARIKTRDHHGKVVTADELWAWIKDRHPTWSEEDQERVFHRVRL